MSTATHEQNEQLRLYDMHCHLDFAENAKEVAAESAAAGIAAVSSTVTPSSFVGSRTMFEPYPNVRVALGAHPWWVANGRLSEVDISRFEELAPKTRFIGEIGLDFSGNCKCSHPRQKTVFYRALQTCKDKVIFIHAVKATTAVLDMLDTCNTFKNNTVVFHWFHGSQEEFDRALAAGAWFSVGARMLANGKTRLFAQAAPNERLLLETDNPPHEGMMFGAKMWQQELEHTLQDLANLRGTHIQSLQELLAKNSETCLSA